jgi:hypothetical protein
MNGVASLVAHAPWVDPLRSLGLRPDGDGAVYRNGKIGFRVQSGWGTFESKGKEHRGGLLGPPLGRAGLWRNTTDARRKKVRGVFELPPSILARAGSDAGGFAELAAWALSTAGGEADPSWSPPTRPELERWVPDRELTLQVGAIARQGMILRDDRHLALRIPVVPKVPKELPAARKEWLTELLVDGQSRWRLVRIGLSDRSEVQAEVDFTGAPHEALEQLMLVGLDALRIVVSSLVEPADFLINGAGDCRAVEVGPTGRRPRTRRRR